MTGPIEVVSCNQPCGTETQDAVAVSHVGEGLAIALADGAGNSASAGQAARHVVAGIMEFLVCGGAHADEAALVAMILDLDAAVLREFAAETTAIACRVERDRVIGVSVGDSAIWGIAGNQWQDLTEHQFRKPLLGSGAAVPVSFECSERFGTILVASDGLLKYSSPQRICDAVRFENPDHCRQALLEAVRLPSGGYQDDVSFALIRCVRMVA